MATTDRSVLCSPIQIGLTGFLQLLQSYQVGTEEVKQALIHHCDFIMECKVCRSLFRGLPNFLAHKRHYCQDPNRNFEVSLENVRIVQTNTTTVHGEGSVFGDKNARRKAEGSHSEVIDSEIDSSPDQTTKLLSSETEADIIDGVAPIPCHRVAGLSSFLRHHGLVDESGRVCSLCKFKTADMKRMRGHMYAHHLKKRSFLQCSHCLKVFNKIETLQTHLAQEHSLGCSEAKKAMNIRKSRVEKFVVNDKVYNMPLSKPQGDFKDVSRQIVLKMFDCLDLLTFTDSKQCHATCRLHPMESLDGFQNVRRHLVEFHLKSNNVCMFCSHRNSSFGHLVKHMVLSHDLTIDKINGMKENIRVHFAKDDAERLSAGEALQEELMPSVNKEQVDGCYEDENGSDTTADSHQSEQGDDDKPSESLKRQHSNVNLIDVAGPVRKQQKVQFELSKPVKPVSAHGLRSWMSFIRYNRFFSVSGKCHYCDAVLKNSRSQGRHLLNRHLKKQLLFQCRQCSLVFQQAQAFKSHSQSCHGAAVENPSKFQVEKLVLQNGRVYDIPARLQSMSLPVPSETSEKLIGQVPASQDVLCMSSAVLYSEREMLLAIITCMYIIKFKATGNQMAQCVHHPEAALQSFPHIVEHLISNHIKDDYTCFMCPFRRKDANSLVKHMALSHHMSVDRIQRLKEKIKSSLNISELTDAIKLNFASVCLRATDQIIAILMSNRDGHGSDMGIEDGGVLGESSIGGPLPLDAGSRSPKCFFSSKDLMLALIDCLGVLRFRARPKTYQPQAKYLAECLEHASHPMEGLSSILDHLSVGHLKVPLRCPLCVMHAQSLESLAEHLIRIHGLDVKKIIGMRDAIRFSLLRKPNVVNSVAEIYPGSVDAISGSGGTLPSGRGIPCPRCGKKFTTFKRISKHLHESHLVRPKLVTRLIERLRVRMQRKDQKSKTEHSKASVARERIQTKSGRVVRKMSSLPNDGQVAKDSMFGLDDVKCTICGKSYPSTSSAMVHLTKVHKMKAEEGRKYLRRAVLDMNCAENKTDAVTSESDVKDKTDGMQRLRRGVVKGEENEGASLFGIEDLPCAICRKTFPKRSGLVNHYSRSHALQRDEVYLMLKKLNAHRPVQDSGKCRARELSVQSKRKQLTPKKCEAVVETDDKGEDTAQNLAMEDIRLKTSLIIKLEPLDRVEANKPPANVEKADAVSLTDAPVAAESTKSENNPVSCTSTAISLEDVSDENGSQAALPGESSQSVATAWSVPMSTTSNRCGKDAKRGLFRCVKCSRFFAGNELTDSESPKCGKCQNSAAN